MRGGQVIARWNRFWFAEGPSDRLVLLRCFFGIAILLELSGYVGFSRLGLWELPHHRFSDPERYFIADLRIPWPGLAWIPAPSYAMFRGIERVLPVLALLFVFGIWTRLVGGLLLGGMAYQFLLSQVFYRHHVYLILIVLMVLIGTPSPRRGETCSQLPLRLIQVLVSAIYLFALLVKLNQGYGTGRVLEILYHVGRMSGWGVDALLGWFPVRLFGPCTLLAEGLLVFGLWVPRLRRMTLWVGVTLHLGIDWMLSVGAYSFEMMALYIAFIEPSPRGTVVLGAGRWPRFLDWLSRIQWLERGGADVPPGLPQSGVVVVTAQGEVLRGVGAWRHLLSRLPLTFLPAGLLYLLPLRR